MRLTPKQILSTLQERYKGLLEALRIDIVSCKARYVELGAPCKWETSDAHDTRLYRFVPMGYGKVKIIQKLVAGKERDRLEYESESLPLADLLDKEFGAKPSDKKTKPKKNYRR